MTATQRTLVLVKPDGVQRGLVGDVLARVERKGLTLAGLKVLQVPRDLAEAHYAEHEGKPFYAGLVDFITSAPVVAFVAEGPNAIKALRQIAGATNPIEAAPSSVRGQYAVDIGRNIIHASDGEESAQREVKLWFEDAELISYTRPGADWLTE